MLNIVVGTPYKIMRQANIVNITLLIAIITHSVSAQQSIDTISINEVFRMAIELETPDSQVLIQNKTIIIPDGGGDVKGRAGQPLYDIYSSYLYDRYSNTDFFVDDKIKVRNRINLKNVTFGQGRSFLRLANLTFRGFWIENNSAADVNSPRFDIYVDNCKIIDGSLVFQTLGLRRLFLRNNTFTGRTSIFIRSDKASTQIMFDSNTFNGGIRCDINQCEQLIFIENNFNYQLNSDNKTSVYGRETTQNIGNIYGGDIFLFGFSDNKITSAELGNVFDLEVRADYYRLIRNTFSPTINLGSSSAKEEIWFRDNIFHNRVVLKSFRYSGFTNFIFWDQFDGNKLGSIHEEQLYLAENEIELADKVPYKEFLRSYYKLHNTFRENGDMESANACYAEMKDIEARRLKYLYQTQGGFENYFKWKLNRILKFYTNHGTSPALAIVVSMYVVLGFAIFYFFFPSEWDVASKNKLIKDFKEFTEKNDKGYIKPFLNMIYGFLISLLNAITLSLNSFVTLGFGTIPTRGLARYVCVLQGFIGWFLLSIFTVALINQVLF